MLRAAAAGDWDGAADMFVKRIPFPRIISRVCDHPCEAGCRRGAVDEPVSVHEVERAIMSLRARARKSLRPLPGRGKQVAIVGAGLSGLTAAVDLAAKGYAITVLDRRNEPAGTLREYDEATLPRELIEADLAVFEALPVTFRLGCEVGGALTVQDLVSDVDAVLLAMGAASGNAFVLAPGLAPGITVDPVTFQTPEPGVFGAGSAIHGTEPYSPIRSLSDGRRAAISLDRYLQKVSLTASRENEGSYETRLYTSVQGVEPEPRVRPADPAYGFSGSEAQAEARRCMQCECMECVKVCQYLAEFKAYPKSYVRQIYNNLSIVAGQRQGNLLINSCTLCGLCEEVCPNDLHMGHVCRAARRTMVQQRRMPPSAHEFALRDLAFSAGDRFSLARHQPGFSQSRYLFFPGCQLSGSAPGHVRKAYAYLMERLQGGVGIMLGCCGAPADWSGRTGLFDEVFASFATQWRDMGDPMLILACSSCHDMLHERMPREKLTSLWQMMDELGLPEPHDLDGPVTLSVHDPCTARNEPLFREPVRRILRTLGVTVEELPLSGDKSPCCTFGGLQYFANRPLADKTVQRRINEGSHPYLAYCAMCRDQFAQAGKPALHLLDLVFGLPGHGHGSARGPDYSDRRENRSRLKRSLLHMYGETEMPQETGPRVRLHVSEEVRANMERRMILVEDIEEVIARAEQTGTRLVHRETGRFLARYRPAAVTYWVEYSPEDDGFRVHRAYSHRMEILEAERP